MSDTPIAPLLRLDGVSKTFVMHLRGGAVLSVLRNVGFAVNGGECAVLGGPSGIGKSSILRMIFGNYSCDSGSIWLRDGTGLVDVATASPRRIGALRRTTMSYVSQFLRVIPRVGAREIVAAAAREAGIDRETSEATAGRLLERLHVPQRLWHLPPATFSGGEQQRINIARCFAANRPLLLLDEPTASLDAANRAVVVELIAERKRAGAGVLGIFHDQDVRDQVADRIIDVTKFAAA